jgi:hypothetical protein
MIPICGLASSVCGLGSEPFLILLVTPRPRWENDGMGKSQSNSGLLVAAGAAGAAALAAGAALVAKVRGNKKPKKSKKAKKSKKD